MTKSQFIKELLKLGFTSSCLYSAPLRYEYDQAFGSKLFIYLDTITDFEESLTRIKRRINGNLTSTTEEGKQS